MNQKSGSDTPIAEREGVFSVEELQPFLHNPRRHTERNMGMLARSLRESGAARGIVIDEDNTVLAGNGVLDAAVDVGIHNVRVVKTEGDELVVVQVNHLTPEQKKRYAIADNRTSELSSWDVDELREMLSDGISLDMFFTQEEQDDVMTTNAYRPSLDPEARWEPVTAEAVAAHQEYSEHRFEVDSSSGIVEHVCPNCGKSVYLRK